MYKLPLLKKTKLKKTISALVLVTLLIAVTFVLIRKNKESQITSLNVVTMPFLVNTEYAQSLLAEMWNEIEPGIELNFVERDYESTEYPEGIDVLTFDFENIDYLSSLGYFRELDLKDAEAVDSLIPVASENLYSNGKVYGIPQLVCGSYLVYHKGDREMDQVENLFDLCEVLKKGNTEGLPITADPDKIWMDLESQYEYYALDAVIDNYGAYATFNKNMVNENIPEVYDNFDYISNWSIGTESGEIDPDAFREGRGRAIICFSEKINAIDMNPEELSFKTISFSNGQDIPLLYIDSVAVSDSVKDDARYEKCLKLVNLMTGKEYLKRLLAYEGKPQYLMPARSDVFKEYALYSDIYNQLYDQIMNEKMYQFRGGSENMNTIISIIKEYRQYLSN